MDISKECIKIIKKALPSVEQILSICEEINFVGEAEWNCEKECYDLYPDNLRSLAQALAKRIKEKICNKN